MKCQCLKICKKFNEISVLNNKISNCKTYIRTSSRYEDWQYLFHKNWTLIYTMIIISFMVWWTSNLIMIPHGMCTVQLSMRHIFRILMLFRLNIKLITFRSINKSLQNSYHCFYSSGYKNWMAFDITNIAKSLFFLRSTGGIFYICWLMRFTMYLPTRC